MSEKAGALLKNARKSAGMTRPQVYQVTAISESVLDRWERGETVPDLESLDKLELLYRSPGLWQECLMIYYPSFRRHFPQMVTLETLPALVNTRHQLQDVLALSDTMERDAMDGRIDNAALKAKYISECQESRAALTEAITRLEAMT